MGTDIRWVVEVRRGDAWEVVSTDGEIDWNYQIFFALSGIHKDIVRSRGYAQEPHFVPRHEMPPDASGDLRIIVEYESTKPFDWRTLAEFQAHNWSWCGGFGNMLAEMARLGAPENVRAIWWFD